MTFSIKWQYFCSLWKKLKEKAMSKNDKMKQSEREEAEGFDDLDINEQEVAEENVADALSELEEEFQREKDRYMRLFAEFENYKKRAVKDKLDLMKTAAQDTLSALLPVLDDFDRAGKAAGQGGNADSFNAGIGLIIQKLSNILAQRGLSEMESNGVAFDPELHEAITEIPAPAEEMKGVVVDTVEKGYYLNDKIIRHAKVVVGK